MHDPFQCSRRQGLPNELGHPLDLSPWVLREGKGGETEAGHCSGEACSTWALLGGGLQYVGHC